MSYPNKFVQGDGLKTRYIEAGSGPAVICLHAASLGFAADVFEGNFRPLVNANGVIAYDPLGFDLTANSYDYSIAYQRKFIVKFIAVLGLEQPAMIGHSQAGDTAVANAFMPN